MEQTPQVDQQARISWETLVEEDAEAAGGREPVLTLFPLSATNTWSPSWGQSKFLQAEQSGASEGKGTSSAE